jgi:hypothetical protein
MKKDVITELQKLAWAEELFPTLAGYTPIVERAVSRGMYAAVQAPAKTKPERQPDEKKKEGNS